MGVQWTIEKIEKEKMMNKIDEGYCQCGCGCKTKIAMHTRTKIGHIKGEAIKFINGHNARGTLHHHWKGGRTITTCGYVRINMPNHPRADRDGGVLEHVLIAEKALGKPLPSKAEVHHVNDKKGDNSRGNHVICQDTAYHMLLHVRARALKACGHAKWRKCVVCKQYDDLQNMMLNKRLNRVYHRQCVRDRLDLLKTDIKAMQDNEELRNACPEEKE